MIAYPTATEPRGWRSRSRAGRTSPSRSPAGSPSSTASGSGAKCFYQQGNETFSEGEDEKVVTVNAAYLEQHVPFVRDRLKLAGIRLGNLLNATLGQ